jgi:hypothetical protein
MTVENVPLRQGRVLDDHLTSSRRRRQNTSLDDVHHHGPGVPS